MAAKEKKSAKDKKFVCLAIAVFIFLLAIRLYPAMMNDYPKGSDSWYHLERSKEILQGDLFYDRLNAGGALSAYPPLFHLMIMPVFFTADPLEAAKIVAPVTGFIALLAFFLFAKKLADEKSALAATFIFGISVEIVNTAIFLAPQNAGFILMFLALYSLLGNKKWAFAACSILLALTHALSFIIFVFIALAIGWERKKLLLQSLAVAVLWALGTKLAGAYSAIITINPIVLSQYAFGFSPLLLAMAVLGIGKSTKRLSFVFIALTAYSFFLGAYPERVFTFSIIPASLLAGIGFVKYWKLFSDEKAIQAGLVLVLVIASLFVFNYNYARAELRQEDKAVLDWARQNTEKNATIAARWQVSGSWIPFVAERKNILGSFQESVPDYMQRRHDLDAIFTSNDKARIIETMGKYNATYIYVNEVEDVLLSPNSVKKFSSMFKEAAGNSYAHLYKI